MPHKYKVRRREYEKRYRQLNRVKLALASKQRYQHYKVTLFHQIKIEVLTHYGNGKCACVKCGFNNDLALSIDHIKSDGAIHRKEAKVIGGIRFYYWLKKHDYPAGFQTLCMNCQWIKRNTNQEYARGQHTELVTSTASNQLSLLDSEVKL